VESADWQRIGTRYFIALLIGLGIVVLHSHPALARAVSTGPQVLCVQQGSPAPVTGAPCTNSTAFTTIQDAVSVANAGDEIRIASGTYTVASGTVVTLTQSVTLTGGFAGGASGWGTPGLPTDTVIDGQGLGFGIVVQGSVTPTVQVLTVNHGGIQNSQGTITVAGAGINLQNGGVTSGALVISSGATLGVPSGVQSLVNGTTITGPGLVQLSAGQITITGAATIQNFEQDGGTVAGNGVLAIPGSFTWNSGVQQDAGTTTIAGTALLNTAGKLNLFGTRTLTLNGSTTNAGCGGTLTMSPGTTLVNNGNLTISGGWTILASTSTFQPPVFSNNGTAKFPSSTCAGPFIFGVALNSGGPLTFATTPFELTGGGTITGTLTLSSGTVLDFGGTDFSTQYAVSSSLSVGRPSTLRFSGGLTTLSGPYALSGPIISAGGYGIFTGNGTVDVPSLQSTSQNNPGGGITFGSGAGTVTIGAIGVSGGLVELDNPSTLVTTLALSSFGNLTGTTAMTVTGSLTWSCGTLAGAGTTTIPNGSTFSYTASLPACSSGDLSSRALVLDAPATMVGGLGLDSGASITNNSTLTLNGAGIFWTGVGAAPSIINSPGSTLTVSGSAPSGTSVELINDGLVTVPAGSLSLGQASGNGAYNVASSGVLSLSGTMSGSLTSAGALSVGTVGTTLLDGQYTVTGSLNAGGGVVDFAGNGALTPTSLTVGPGIDVDAIFESSLGNLTIGTFTQTIGIVSFNNPTTAIQTANVTCGTFGGTGAVTVSGTLTWGSACPTTMNGTGSTTVASTGAMVMSNGYWGFTIDTRSLVLNGSTTVSNSGGPINLQNGASLINNGTFALNTDASFGAGTGPPPTVFNNGTLTKQTDNSQGGGSLIGLTFQNNGTLEVQSGTLTTVTGGSLTNAGTVLVDAGTCLCFDAGYVQTGGQTTVTGGITTLGTLALEGGSINGTGAINGTVVNSGGTMAPGAPFGQFHIYGSYVQDAGGTLSIEVGGLSQSGELVAEPTTLNGTLAVSLANGFVPQLGDSYPVLTAAPLTGQFSSFLGPNLGNGTFFVPSYNRNGFEVDVIDTSNSPTATVTPTATPSVTSSVTPTRSVTSSPTRVGSPLASMTAHEVFLPNVTQVVKAGW
jgi:fibronectin-binding autotransporter adhesin